MSIKKFSFTKAILDALPSPPNGKRAYYYDTKMRGLGIGITSKGTKSFIVYRWVNGKPERVTLGRYPDLSIEQARGEAGKVNSLIATGTNPNDIRQSAQAEITLGELFSEYLQRHAKLHKRAWKEDEKQFNRYLLPWAKRKLSTIKKQDIQKLHHKIGEEKGHYAANRLLSLLSILFNKAIDFGIWDKVNPAHGIKKFREHSRDRFLQSDELPRFFEALAEEPNDTIRDYLILALLTGARRSNVQAMRILQRAGIKNLRIHDLRRTLGSWQAKTGASLVIIGKSLNHKSPTTTAIYARLDLDPVREAVKRATNAMLTAAGVKVEAEASS